MIEVKVNQESFAYDIHSLIKAFYPEEEDQCLTWEMIESD